MDQAVECLLRFEWFDEAEGLAKQIESQPAFVIFQTRILKAQSQGKELVKQFRNHDFSDWPDGRKADAHLLRGTAAYFGRVDPEQARRDPEKALQYAMMLPSHKVAKRRIESYLEQLTADRFCWIKP